MSNPLPEEAKFYQQIKDEHITIDPEIWDLLYHRIGDDLSAINLLCQYYLKANEAIPVEEAKKITKYTHRIKDITNKLTATTKKSNQPFPEIEDSPLHPILREMFTHYIGNDIYMINLIALDIAEEGASLEAGKKILEHTGTIKDFMERLRIATSQGEIQAAKDEKNSEEFFRKYFTKEDIFLEIRKLLVNEFNLKNEESITFKSRFNEDIHLDSVDAIQVVMLLEEAFGFEIPDDDAESIFTMAQAVDYIHKRLKEEKR